MSDRQPRLSLAHLTALDVSPTDLISAAASAGFDAVGVRLRNPPGVESPTVTIDSSVIRATRDGLDATGLTVLDVEALWLDAHGRDADDDRDLFEAAARLGASSLLVMCGDPDERRRLDTFSELCSQAGPYGLSVCLEFAVFTAVRTLQDAERLVQASGQPNARILIDVLHLVRSGGLFEEVARLNPSSLGYVQLCDAVAVGPTEPADCRVEARTDRRYPGEGELPLDELMRVLSADLPIAVEAPCKAYATLSVPERSKLAFDATRSLLERIERHDTES